MPAPLDQRLDAFEWFLDTRHVALLRPLFRGRLLAHGRRTATAWFRAAGLTDDFRRAYPFLGTRGRATSDALAAVLFARRRRTRDPGPRWRFALDDSPTQR